MKTWDTFLSTFHAALIARLHVMVLYSILIKEGGVVKIVRCIFKHNSIYVRHLRHGWTAFDHQRVLYFSHMYLISDMFLFAYVYGL